MDQIKYVFDRFYQVDTSSERKYEGTGIGLSLVKELVDLYEGKIEIKSEVNWGTEVIVQLPIVKVYEQNEVFEQENPDTTSRLSNETESDLIKEKDQKENSILVVEDNQDLRLHIQSLLKNDCKRAGIKENC